MKGIVFREFIQMVEDQFSIETADSIINSSSLASGGSYTSIGTYPHEEMLALVKQLSLRSGRSTSDLLRHFGRHLFHRFAMIHPQYVITHSSAFELLTVLDGHIHKEVHKLYKDAELPAFDHERINEHTMIFVYRSKRAMADFAHGLIEGCIAYFGDPLRVDRADYPQDEGSPTRFTLTRI